MPAQRSTQYNCEPYSGCCQPLPHNLHAFLLIRQWQRHSLWMSLSAGKTRQMPIGNGACKRMGLSYPKLEGTGFEML
jgi:hypothetical protein